MKKLHLGPELGLPIDEAVTETLAILGRRGSAVSQGVGELRAAEEVFS